MTAGMADRVDWAALAGLAMTRLGWSPEIFWSATPADLMMAIGALRGPEQAAPLDRSEFAALRARFPDTAVDPPPRP